MPEKRKSMEQNDKKPVGQEGERKPRRQDLPEGAPAERAKENGAEDGQNRRRRNRHRNRHRGPRENPAEGAPNEGMIESKETNAPKEQPQESPRTEAKDARSDGGEESHREGENGEPKKCRRNRNRRRNRRDNAEASEMIQGAAVLSDEEDEEVLDEAVSEGLDTESEAELFPELIQEETEPAPKESKEPKKPLYTVVGIRFRPGGKIYYFDPADMICSENAHVIVETARGLEFGIVALSNRQVSGRDVVLPLRRIVRFATEEDERRHESNLEKETEAYNLCLSRIEAHRLDMKLVDVEYAFDNSKLLFYFTSEGRVDFRELVKDLASVFRTRIELRQIGIRDEAKLMGGLGVCGRPFCCKSFLPDFVQVSIKMAKEQNLSLNSTKISGACGRLMCCLRYEYDTYVAESAITPKVDAIVDTPDGEGIVTESSPLKGIVKVALNKEPNAAHVYRREDVTVKGHAKKRKNNEVDGKKSEEKK